MRIGIQVLSCACAASALIQSFLVITPECWSPRLLRAIRNCTGYPWKSLQLGKPSERLVGRSCRGRPSHGDKRETSRRERLCSGNATGARRAPCTPRVPIGMGLIYFPALTVRHPGGLLPPPRALLPATPRPARDWSARPGAVADWRLLARATEFKEGAGARCPAALLSPPDAPVFSVALAASPAPPRVSRANGSPGRQGKPRAGLVQAGAGGTVREGRAT